MKLEATLETEVTINRGLVLISQTDSHGQEAIVGLTAHQAQLVGAELLRLASEIQGDADVAS